MDKLDFLVDEDFDNIRIDKYLSEVNKEFSRSYIQKLIKDGQILVNENLIKPSLKLQVNDKVTLFVPEPKSLEIKPMNIPIDIIYEDNDIIVVNKPKGMVVHPAVGHYEDTLVNALLYHSKGCLSNINGVLRPGIVHRIDKDTTGVLVVCKNNNAHNFISEQLKVHSITRKYEAIVIDNIKEDEGKVDTPIGRHRVDRKKQAIDFKNGRNALTNYKVLERLKNKYTYIECKLETGRTHQIRVHMASIGHPILGDNVYGNVNQKFSSLEGQTLHAKVLGFIHPTTKKYVEFKAQLPEYFQNLLNVLR